ncbi:MAG TPA: mannose-6-phosphate isomerase, class I [Deltaproteobacteria bacterium]|nr:mannose-6-phosphate isomerase, class I [Deltaproteobacteria bacterium]
MLEMWRDERVTMELLPGKIPYLLVNKIQHYAWGTRGVDALIPRLLGINPEPDTPYAEFWIGAHPKAPSEVVLGDKRVSLRDFIAMYPREILGKEVAEKFSNELPFLFKVLSAAEPLSIQAHPDKEQARYLHEKDPEHYPDPNHKPELAVALGSFYALAGFRPYEEVLSILKKYPEIEAFVGEIVVSDLSNSQFDSAGARSFVKTLFSALIRRSITHRDDFIAQVEKLRERLSNQRNKLTEVEKLFLEVAEKYDDVGLFALFFLNFIHLERGQGIFIDAGIPHAYVRGNIVECMANSDNVVRVGLTPKYKDAETLLEILTYDTGPSAVSSNVGKQEKILYDVPAEEFRVAYYRLEENKSHAMTGRRTVEIGLVLNGEISISWKDGLNMKEMSFKRGDSFLVPAILESYEIGAKESSEFYIVDVPVGRGVTKS